MRIDEEQWRGQACLFILDQPAERIGDLGDQGKSQVAPRPLSSWTPILRMEAISALKLQIRTLAHTAARWSTSSASQGPKLTDRRSSAAPARATCAGSIGPTCPTVRCNALGNLNRRPASDPTKFAFAHVPAHCANAPRGAD
jgi:hypothetical protein